METFIFYFEEAGEVSFAYLATFIHDRQHLYSFYLNLSDRILRHPFIIAWPVAGYFVLLSLKNRKIINFAGISTDANL